MDPRHGRVQGELPDRDGHPARSLVAQAKDSLVVGHDDQPDVAERRRTEDRRDPVLIVGGDPHAPGPPDDVAEFLARPTDRGRVDDRQELLEVLGQDPIEQGRVAVLERGQADVPLEVVGLAPDVLDLEGDLLLDRQDAIRQESAQAQLDALLGAERQVLGEQAPAQEVRAGLPDGDRLARDHPVERGWKRSHRAKDRRRACPPRSRDRATAGAAAPPPGAGAATSRRCRARP